MQTAAALQKKEQNKTVEPGSPHQADSRVDPTEEDSTEAGMPLFLQRLAASSSSAPPPVQRQPDEEDEEQFVQAKPITPRIQRDFLEEDEKDSPQGNSSSSLLQRQPLEAPEEDIRDQHVAPQVQRQADGGEDEDNEEMPVFPKLTIGAPNDKYEQQADQVADKVMRQTDDSPAVLSKPVSLSIMGKHEGAPKRALLGPGTVRLNHSNASPVHPKFSGINKLPAGPGTGSQLDTSVRRRIEPVLGSDISHVRIHHGSLSQLAAGSINAKAFTYRNDIYLGAGQSAHDLRLMAHEVTHTVQQGATLQEPSLQRDATDQTITPGYATALNDGQLMYEIQLVEDILSTTDVQSDTFESLDGNLQILRTEYFSRDPGANTTGFQEVPNRPGDGVYSGLIPEGGEEINAVGIVAWDGDPRLRLRSSPDTSTTDNIIAHLEFSARLQVIKRFPGGWYFVSTHDGYLGYTASDYIFMDLPEPNARLHRVQSGVSGTAIGIAERYYGEYADDWGQDLRFYVNVLAWANNISVPNTTTGWRSVQFNAGQLIWIPSQQFAYSLKGVVNSGSRSYNIAEFLGIAGFLERVGQLWADFRRAVDLSGQYLREAITTQMTESILAMAEGLAWLLLGAVAILAISTAVGAAIGALAGGAGAAPGAAAGFKVGMVIIEWLGLALLVYWIIDSMIQLGSAFGTFLATVWDARGDEETLDRAGREFANAIGLLIAKIFEALLMFLMARGLPRGIRLIRETRFGRALGETRAIRWLTEQSRAIEAGETPLPGPRQVIGRVLRTGRPGAEPATVNHVGQTQHFNSLPPERLPANLPEGHFWMRNSQGEWVLMRDAGAAEVPFELTVYSDGLGNTNYVLRTGDRMIQSDALTRQGSTYAQGQNRLPNELEGTGANNPYRDPITGEMWDKGHGIDYADTLEGPGVRSSTTDVANFTPQQSWWNRGPRNTLVGRIRNGHAATGRPGGGGYREMAIYGENPPVTADGTPIPSAFIFVETNRAGVALRAWRIPNQAGAGTRAIASINPHSMSLSDVPPIMLRTNVPMQAPSAGMTYAPFIIYGLPGDDEWSDAGMLSPDYDEVCIDTEYQISSADYVE